MKKKIGAILLAVIITLALGLPVLPASAGDDTVHKAKNVLSEGNIQIHNK